MRNNFLLFIFWLSMLLSFNQAHADENGLKLFELVINKYRTISSYEDKVDVTKYVGKNIKRKLFVKTHFNRPDQLKILWKYKNNIEYSVSNSLHYNDDDVVVRIGDTKRVYTNFNLALGGLSGITSGVSYLVPRYLLDIVPIRIYDGAIDVSIQKNDMNEPFKKLLIVYPNNIKRYIWIDENHFIRRYERNIQAKSESGKHIRIIINYSDIKTEHFIDEDIFDISKGK